MARAAAAAVGCDACVGDCACLSLVCGLVMVTAMDPPSVFSFCAPSCHEPCSVTVLLVMRTRRELHVILQYCFITLYRSFKCNMQHTKTPESHRGLEIGHGAADQAAGLPGSPFAYMYASGRSHEYATRASVSCIGWVGGYTFPLLRHAPCRSSSGAHLPASRTRT